jgi:guanylate kinase
VFDNFYGTSQKAITNQLSKGKNILLDIDWQGARQVRKKMPTDTVSIFILPPSLKVLKQRLMKRESSLPFVNNRMSKAKKEIAHWNEYDYVVVNKDLQKCLKEIKKILEIQKYKSSTKTILKF